MNIAFKRRQSADGGERRRKGCRESENEKAVVETDGTVTNKRLKEAIANVGFEVTEIQDQF